MSAREFSEFLGRLGFVAQLLTWLKPHLAPLFAWGAVASTGMVGRLRGHGHFDLALLFEGDGS